MIAKPFVSTLVTLAFVAAPSALSGQERGAVTPQTGTQLLMLGTAAGPPLRAERSEPATLLIVDGRRYLIDCGIGTARQLVKAGIPSETIPTIFFTHLHPDHVLGLADVLANDFQQKDTPDSNYPVAIYGPPHTQALVDAAYRYISLSYQVFAAEGAGPRGGVPPATPFPVHEVSEGLVYQDDRIRVTAAENTHYALMPQPSRETMKSYAYRFETPHGTIVFTGDTGPSDALVRLAQGADVLVSEASDFAAMTAFADQMAQQHHWPAQRRDAFLAHMTKEHLDIKDVGQLAARAHAKAVIFYHWDPTNPERYLSGVKTEFTGPVFGSADLQRYCVGDSGDRGSPVAPVRPCK